MTGDRDAAELSHIAHEIRRWFPRHAHEIQVIADRMVGRVSRSGTSSRPMIPPMHGRTTTEVQHRNGRTVLVLRRQRPRAQFAIAR